MIVLNDLTFIFSELKFLSIFEIINTKYYVCWKIIIPTIIND